MDALCEHNAIDTLLSNFILPLQDDQISTVDPATNKVGRLSASWQCYRLLWLLKVTSTSKAESDPHGAGPSALLTQHQH